MNPMGAILIVVGLAGAVWPYEVALFEEQVDSIGSKRSWGEVEPAEWKVTVTRVMGVVFAVVGLLLLFGG